jgi:hypothetical protein
MARVAVVSGTATAVSGRVQRRQQRRWGAEDQQEMQPEQPAPQQQPDAPEDPLARLKELGELRDSGVLTEEEFTAQKAMILNS